MTALRTVLATGAAMLVTLLAAPAAGAAIPWAQCAAPLGFQCAAVPVPLDWTGATPGAIPLSVQRVQAASNPTRTAVVGLAGGPGQAALPSAPLFTKVLAAGLTTRDLLLFDQRGTGASNALNCPRLSLSSPSSIRSCALAIGPARAFYRTADSVADLEALRVAAGYDKLVLYGVSYGTKVALRYAATYPNNVEALILDSVVTPEGPDALTRSSLKATTRIVTDQCAAGRCRRATPSPAADLRALARKLRKKPLRASFVASSGRTLRTKLTQADLFQIMATDDLNPITRAGFPGAVRAALRGDGAPLLRIGVRANGGGTASGLQQPERGVSEALSLTTTCEETVFPWARDASTAARRVQLVSAARKIPAADLGPFSPAVVTQYVNTVACLNWPNATPAPAADPVALPPVRTLMLAGQLDVRTPLEDAYSVAARIPGAEVVVVPYVGHSVASSDLSGCAIAAVTTFFGGGAATPCPAAPDRFPPTAKPPASLDAVKAPKKIAGKRGRSLAAVAASIADADNQRLAQLVAGGGDSTFTIGGLRSGTMRVSGRTITLRRYEYVPGVLVSGSLNLSTGGTVTVSGRAASSGRLTFGAGGSISGTLGGRKVSIAAASARRAGNAAERAVSALLAQRRPG